MKPILIVGAGFAGAVHARELAEAGYAVHVIDRRPHIAGNAFDYVDPNGIRIHAYGPHLFHSKQQHVIGWMKRFAEFVPYIHKVRAALPGGAYAPLPINLYTVNLVFGTNYHTSSQVAAHLRAVSLPISKPANAAEYLHSQIGVVLTDLLFRPYTKTMWAMDLEQMAPAVTKRIPLHTDRTDTYFPVDEIQMLPREGYTKLFASILGHKNILVTLNKAFNRRDQKDYQFCFNAMAIDEYFEFSLGKLPYRSLRFHHRTATVPANQDWSVTNFTDSGPYTRETSWHLLPHHLVNGIGRHTITLEEPCDYQDNNFERFYPVKTADGSTDTCYRAYRELAATERNIAFIGRCGTYQYLDMDQVINQSMQHVKAWINQRRINVRPAA